MKYGSLFCISTLLWILIVVGQSVGAAPLEDTFDGTALDESVWIDLTVGPGASAAVRGGGFHTVRYYAMFTGSGLQGQPGYALAPEKGKVLGLAIDFAPDSSFGRKNNFLFGMRDVAGKNSILVQTGYAYGYGVWGVVITCEGQQQKSAELSGLHRLPGRKWLFEVRPDHVKVFYISGDGETEQLYFDTKQDAPQSGESWQFPTVPMVPFIQDLSSGLGEVIVDRIRFTYDLPWPAKDQPQVGERQISAPARAIVYPKLLQPGDNEQRIVLVGPDGDELRWKPQAGATRYTVEIWPAGGDKRTVRSDRPYWQPDANLKPGRWHWRVIAHTAGYDSRWSDQWLFRQGDLRKLNAGAVKQASTPLRVQDRAGVARDNWPVTSGLPFPKGAIFSTDNLRLEDDAGREIALQPIVTSRWPDGSIRWTLLDFQLSLGAGETETLTLHYGSDVGRAELPRMAIETPSGVAAAEVIIEDEGGEYRCKLFDQLPQMEIDGPLHSVALYQADMRDGDGDGRYRLRGRVHRYAGRRHCKLELAFVNEHPEELRNISRIELRLPAEFAARQYAVGGDGDAIMAGEIPDAGVRLRQEGPAFYDENRQPIKWELSTGPSGEQAAGWAHIRGDESLTVAVRRMAQLHPKALAMNPDGITVELWPSDHEPYECGRGTAKTHDILIAGGTPDSEAARDMGLGFCTPLFAAATPEWYCASGAFGDIVPRNPELFPKVERWIDNMIENHARIRRSEGEWGMRDFGDWGAYSRYPHGWYNNEYDTGYVTALHFARSGDLRWLDETEIAAQHYADIDCCHWCPDGSSGWPHVHWTDHWRAGNHLGHTWLQGLVFDYLLTGNRWSYEMGLAVGDFCAGVGFDRDLTNQQERSVGWMLICLMEVYKLTGQQRYLDAATNIVDQAYDWQDKEIGYLPHPIGDCRCEGPKCVGGKPFMMGLVFEGMRGYHEVTGSRKAREIIERAAHWLADYQWVEADKGYKGGCKQNTRGENRDLTELMGMGYAWELTGREEYLLQPLKQLAERADYLTDDRGGGKISVGYTRSSVMFLSLVSRTLGPGWKDWARAGKLPPDLGKPE